VLKAIAADIPFDEFSIRQMAGDMLPNASNDDLVATGFRRNTMLNEKGGIDSLEFSFHAMTVRVATTGLVWMGLTTGCAQCHTHKHDPITHRDYYAMMAIMNNANEVEQEIDAGQLAERRREIEAEILVREDRWIDTNFAEKVAEATVDATSDSVRTAYRTLIPRSLLTRWISGCRRVRTNRSSMCRANSRPQTARLARRYVGVLGRRVRAHADGRSKRTGTLDGQRS
jgi:hypothetical protein